MTVYEHDKVMRCRYLTEHLTDISSKLSIIFDLKMLSNALFMVLKDELCFMFSGT